jgi:hypothetical protein
MNSGHRRGYVVVLFGAMTSVVAFVFLYRVRPLATVTVGSGAIALAVLAHLGVLAAVVGPLIASRRRKRP